MSVSEVIQKIQEAVKDRDNPRKISFDYIKKAGEHKREENIDPYKIDQGWFWGAKPDGIRKFALERMSNVVIINATYTPQWDIEIEELE